MISTAHCWSKSFVSSRCSSTTGSSATSTINSTTFFAARNPIQTAFELSFFVPFGLLCCVLEEFGAMGFNNRQKKSSSSSFSVFNLFKFRKARRGDNDTMDYARRVWPSDEDKVRWVADPAIDRKARDFIDKIHRNIVSDSEPHIVTVNPAGQA